MPWNPALGTKSLEKRLGRNVALKTLIGLLTEEVSGEDLVWSPYRDVLEDIGDGHATRLMADSTGARLAYWPRVWAARSLAYLGDVRATTALVEAIGDDHWRVRMTAIQTLGRLGVEGVTSHLAGSLDDEHPRVRRAAVVALGRVGTEEALERLAGLLLTGADIGAVELSIRKITQRTETGDQG